MSDKIQPYAPGGQLGPRRQQRPSRSNGGYESSPRCPICNSSNLQPFSAIYGHGTTDYRTHKGLLIPSGFQKTRRQSVIAANCAPPRKMSWWPTMVAVLFSFALYSATRILVNIADVLVTYAYWLLWLALGLATLTAIRNFALYPDRLAAWGRKLFCQKCGAAFEIPV